MPDKIKELTHRILDECGAGWKDTGTVEQVTRMIEAEFEPTLTRLVEALKKLMSVCGSTQLTDEYEAAQFLLVDLERGQGKVEERNG